jgi:outer membrane protein, heavy metal efflux system
MRTLPLTLLGLSLAVGCATVDPEPSLHRVQELNLSRSGPEIIWERTPEDRAKIEEQVAALLEGGLTRGEAVQIAVLNSPELQAQFADLGIAAADLTQAGLLQNPFLDVIIASPKRVGSSGITLGGWLSDLWTIPRKVKVAEMALRRTEFEVALAVMMKAHQAARSWDRVVTARAELALAKDLLESRTSIAKRTDLRFGHGLADTQLVQQAARMLSEQQVLVRQAEQALTEASTGLAWVLAVNGAADLIDPAQSLPAPPAEQLSLQEALDLALERRLDLAIAQAEVEHTARRLGLEKALVWDVVLIGAGYEGDFKRLRGGENTIGPVVLLELPIFDQNQARKAAATFRIQRATSQLEAVQHAALKDVVDSHRRLERTQHTLEDLEGPILEAAQAELAYAREWNNRMQLPYMGVLEAHEKVLVIEQQIIEGRRRVNVDWLSFQMALHGGTGS